MVLRTSMALPATSPVTFLIPKTLMAPISLVKPSAPEGKEERDYGEYRTRYLVLEALEKLKAFSGMGHLNRYFKKASLFIKYDRLTLEGLGSRLKSERGDFHGAEEGRKSEGC